MPDDENVFSHQIDHKNKMKVVPVDTSLRNVDTDGELYDDLEAVLEVNNSASIEDFNSFPSVSRTRDRIYEAYDRMCEDSRISAAIEIYTDCSCEPNKDGNIVWCESKDERVAAMVKYLLECINVNKYVPQWMNSLVRYGDVYLRMYRESELHYHKPDSEQKGIHWTGSLNEDLILRAYSKKDKYDEFIEMNLNPAEVFELRKNGKTVAYVKTTIETRKTTDDLEFNNWFNHRYKWNMDDVELLPADSFVHACLDNVDARDVEEVVLGTVRLPNGMIENDYDPDYNPDVDANYQVVYRVRRGKSILYDAYKIWKTLSLLENAILLNRLTKSSIVKIVEVETGDMDRSHVKAKLNEIKSVVEQKTAMETGKNFTEYLNTSPVENLVFTSIHEGKGAINVKELGGSDKSLTDQLNDLDYFKTKLYAALGIPKAYLGDTNDSTGFNGGSSLTLISSQFAKRCKKLQNALISALTDCINLLLIDRGLYSYVNKFRLMMQAPTTQEEKDRKDAYNSNISSARDTLDLIASNGIDDPKDKLRILKTMLAGIGVEPEVLEIIQEKIEDLEDQDELNNAGDGTGGEAGGGEPGGFDDLSTGSSGFGSGEMGDLGGGLGMDQGFEEEGGGTAPQPIDTSAITGGEGGETPMENFYNGSGTTLNEQNSLPSWNDLGLSYNSVKIGR